MCLKAGGRLKLVNLGGNRDSISNGWLNWRLIDMGVPEHEARHYEDAVRQGKTLLTVRAEDDASAERVASIMDDCGAVDIEGDADRDRTGRPAELGANRIRVRRL